MTAAAPRVLLVNMPFAAPAIPSLALTQLQAVAERRLAGRVRIETLYLNHDFARYLGDLEAYRHVLSNHGFMTGIGDWFFRQAAFPSAPDNTAEYFARYYAGADAAAQRAWQGLLARRPGVEAFLEALIAQYGLAEADVVGLTALFAQTTASFAMARRLKARRPGILTLIGGAACSGEMGLEFAQQVDCVDYFFSGPGLVSFPDFLESWLAGDLAAAARRPGIIPGAGDSAAAAALEQDQLRNGHFREGTAREDALRRGSGQACPPNLLQTPVSPLAGETPACPEHSRRVRRDHHLTDPSLEPAAERPFGAELDINTPLPLDYRPFLDSLDRAFPGGGVQPVLLFETSRGCWWGERQRCAFCGLNGPELRHRAMQPERAVAQIRALFPYAGRCALLAAVDTILPRHYVAEVLPALQPPPGLKIQYEVRPQFSAAELQALCAAGVTVLQPGIESLCTATLQRMHKGTTAFQNIRFLKACSRFPLEIGWNLLIHAPGEDAAVVARYLDLIPRLTHLHPPQSASLVGFVRYSEYFEQARAHGLELRPEDHYRLTFPFDAAALGRIAVKFYDARADAERQADDLRRLNAAIAAWRTRWLNADGRGEARLCRVRDGDRTLVYDSRPGAAVQYPLTPRTAAVLDQLEQPRSAADLAAAVPGLAPADAGQELAWLRARGLLFEEDGRQLSLLV